MSKILFHRNDYASNVTRKMNDEYGGVGYYRIVQPHKFLKGHETELVGIGLKERGESIEQKWKRIFTTYDVFWTSYFFDEKEASAMFYFRDKYKKKVVIDLDDNYLDIAPTHSLYDSLKPTKRGRAFISTILSFADVVTVSTEPLKQKMNEHFQKVYGLKKTIMIVPNMNEMKTWDFKLAKKDPEKVVIGYTGSNSHYDDMEMFVPKLATLMDKYPNVYFQCMGTLRKDEAVRLFQHFSESAKLRCDLVSSTWTFKEYPAYLAKHPWDIGIAPLVDTSFTRCKSHIKWLEYSILKIPTVASRVYPYSTGAFGRDTIQDGVTGRLVKPSEWVDALEELIVDKKKRREMGNNAYNFVKENWQYGSDFSARLEEVLKAL